ncbi:glycosyltransferase [Polluticoccus soli]|uniref:glycosyltransferase n=1 Tax=Polluticoccus soli TaxID=3034150 RepID=UPI0023E31899|nr:glycosyltransferase [Flavipsychrobacter sp. JY13-12]
MTRVALIGNMNNNFFAITRHLRDLGYDAHLFYRVAMDHFTPEADCWDEDYKEYCHEVNWLDKGICLIDEQRIREELNRFDFFIGQGDEAAAAHRAGVDMDVYYPYGSDVYKYAQLQQEFLPRHKVVHYLKSKDYAKTRRMLERGTPSKSMRGVIVNAKHILVDHTNEDFECQLRSLKCKGKIEHVPMPFIYPKAYQNRLDEKSNGWSDIIENVRRQYELLILYHGRQEWKSKYNEFTPKNTHHLIIGFADFLKQKRSSACLIMLDYGYDVQYSKQLITELGIAKHVIWLPKMMRKEIMNLISHVDVCAGEFGRSYLTFGTIVEAMLMGKPVIHHRDDALYVGAYPELYPLLNAREPDEIARAISLAADNPAHSRIMGKDASAWIKQFFIEKPLQRLVTLIENKIYDSGYATNNTALSKI